MIVVDASVATAGLIDRDSPARPYIERHDLHVPHLIDQEVMSAVRRLMLGGDIPGSDADMYIERWAQLRMTRRSVSDLISRIWELRHNLTPYDATYVALAAALETRLITRDRKLKDAPVTACEIVLV